MAKPDFYKHFESNDQLAEFEEYARKPGTTIQDCIAWVTTNLGVSVSPSAMGREKQRQDELAIAERAKSAGSLARAFMDTAKEAGGLEIPDAAVLYLSQMIYEQSVSADRSKVTPEDLATLSLALQRLTLGKQRIETIREELAEKMTKELNRKRKQGSGVITEKDVLEVRQFVFGKKK